MRYILFIFLIFVCTLCYAENWGRVSIEKSTGKLIEFQSGNATLGTLKNNAINSGYNITDIEEKYVTKSEFDELRQRWIIEPKLEKLEIERQNKLNKKNKIKQKLGLSESDWEDLIEAIK